MGLTFSISPTIDKYTARILELKGIAKTLLGFIVADFAHVSGAFKNQTTLTEAVDCTRLSIAFRDLQYFDILTQKISHCVDLHEALLTSTSNSIASEKTNEESETPDHASFIFKLNHLQVIAIANEYTQIASSIATAIKNHHHDQPENSVDSRNLFTHTSKINEALNRMMQTLGIMLQERLAEAPINASIAEQMMKISDFYTMESERYILCWLVKNLTGHPTDLLSAYSIQDFGHVEKKIELF